MLYRAAVFFVIAIIAGVPGFAAITAATAEVAKLLFPILMVLFIIAMVMSMPGRRQRPLRGGAVPASAPSGANKQMMVRR